MGSRLPDGLDGWIISQPAKQERLTDVIPRGEIPTHYLNRYASEEEVRCAFCDKHTPHKRGFTAQMADGRIALCGRDCAAKYFGKEKADQFERELEKQIERAARKRIAQRTVEGAPITIAMLTPELIETEGLALNAIGALHDEIRAAELPSRLNDNGDAEITETKRRWVEREDANGLVKKVPIDEVRVIFKIHAASVLRNTSTAKRRFASARHELEMLSSIRSLDEISNQILDRIQQKRTSIINDLTNAERFLRLCQRFFTPENIRALSSFAQMGKGHVERVRIESKSGTNELVIVRKDFTFLDYDEPEEARSRRYRLPDFSKVPPIEVLLAALKDGDGQVEGGS